MKQKGRKCTGLAQSAWRPFSNCKRVCIVAVALFGFMNATIIALNRSCLINNLILSQSRNTPSERTTSTLVFHRVDRSCCIVINFIETIKIIIYGESTIGNTTQRSIAVSTAYCCYSENASENENRKKIDSLQNTLDSDVGCDSVVHWIDIFDHDAIVINRDDLDLANVISYLNQLPVKPKSQQYLPRLHFFRFIKVLFGRYLFAVYILFNIVVILIVLLYPLAVSGVRMYRKLQCKCLRCGYKLDRIVVACPECGRCR